MAYKINSLRLGKNPIKAIYFGMSKIVDMVEGLYSCYGKGYWINQFPWLNQDKWVN